MYVHTFHITLYSRGAGGARILGSEKRTEKRDRQSISTSTPGFEKLSTVLFHIRLTYQCDNSLYPKFLSRKSHDHRKCIRYDMT